jgi:hypothetical protein
VRGRVRGLLPFRRRAYGIRLVWGRAQTCGWVLVGDAAELRRSKERNDALTLLHDADGPLSPKDLAELLGKPREVVKVLLWSMARDGEVRADQGRYSPVAPRPSASTDYPDYRLTSPGVAPRSPVIGGAAPDYRPASAPPDTGGRTVSAVGAVSGGVPPRAVRWALASFANGHFCKLDAHAPSDYDGTDGRRYCGTCWPAQAAAGVP